MSVGISYKGSPVEAAPVELNTIVVTLEVVPGEQAEAADDRITPGMVVAAVDAPEGCVAGAWRVETMLRKLTISGSIGAAGVVRLMLSEGHAEYVAPDRRVVTVVGGSYEVNQLREPDNDYGTSDIEIALHFDVQPCDELNVYIYNNMGSQVSHKRSELTVESDGISAGQVHGLYYSQGRNENGMHRRYFYVRLTDVRISGSVTVRYALYDCLFLQWMYDAGPVITPGTTNGVTVDHQGAQSVSLGGVSAAKKTTMRI